MDAFTHCWKIFFDRTILTSSQITAHLLAYITAKLEAALLWEDSSTASSKGGDHDNHKTLIDAECSERDWVLVWLMSVNGQPNKQAQLPGSKPHAHIAPVGIDRPHW